MEWIVSTVLARPVFYTCLAVMLLAAPAYADGTREVDKADDKKMRFKLRLGSGWTVLPQPDDARTPLAGYRHRGYDALIAINRVDYPNIPAWRTKERDAYFDEIERGIRATVTDYKRLGQDRGRLRNIPFYQVTFRHRSDDGRRMVLMRFIFYRRYSVSMSLDVPARSYRKNKKALQKIRDTFAPLY